MLSSSHHRLNIFETLDLCWAVDGVAIGFRRECNAALSECVESPAPDFAVFGQGKGMIGTSVEVNDLAALWERDGSRNQVDVGMTFKDATAKLALLSHAPSIDNTLLVKSDGVILAARDFLDVLETLDENRSFLLGNWLSFVVKSEAEDALVILE